LICKFLYAKKKSRNLEIVDLQPMQEAPDAQK
jgi:hypothetical protein